MLHISTWWQGMPVNYYVKHNDFVPKADKWSPIILKYTFKQYYTSIYLSIFIYIWKHTFRCYMSTEPPCAALTESLHRLSRFLSGGESARGRTCSEWEFRRREGGREGCREGCREKEGRKEDCLKHLVHTPSLTQSLSPSQWRPPLLTFAACQVSELSPSYFAFFGEFASYVKIMFFFFFFTNFSFLLNFFFL